MGPCGDGLCCAPVPAADQVEIHRKTLAAAMLVLPQIWHHLNISAQVVRRETHIAVVALIAPSPPMESKTCMCCKQKCTEYKWMNRFTPHSHAALYTPARSKPFCYITSTRRGITRSHGTCPAMLWVMQDIRLGAMQPVQEVLQCMQVCVQAS